MRLEFDNEAGTSVQSHWKLRRICMVQDYDLKERRLARGTKYVRVAGEDAQGEGGKRKLIHDIPFGTIGLRSTYTRGAKRITAETEHGKR